MGDQAVMDTYVLGSPFTTAVPERAYACMSEFLQATTIDGITPRVFMEAPVVAGARNIQSTIKQAMVSGALQTAVSEWGEPAVLVAVSSWKAGVGMGGNAGKQRVREWLADAQPGLSTMCAYDQDLIDASCVALYGAELMERASGMDAMGAVQKPESPILHTTRVRSGVRRTERVQRTA